MNQGLNQFQAVFMAGQKKVKKFMEKNKEKEEKEKIWLQQEGKEKKI